MILFALFSLFHPSQLLVVCKINPIYECSNSYLTGLGNMLTDIISDETYHRPLPIEGGMNGVELFKQFHLQLSFVSFLISFFFVSEASFLEVFHIVGLYAPSHRRVPRCRREPTQVGRVWHHRPVLPVHHHNGDCPLGEADIVRQR